MSADVFKQELLVGCFKVSIETMEVSDGTFRSRTTVSLSLDITKTASTRSEAHKLGLDAALLKISKVLTKGVTGLVDVIYSNIQEE